MAVSQLFTTYVRHLRAWTELLRVWHRQNTNYYNLKRHAEVTSRITQLPRYALFIRGPFCLLLTVLTRKCCYSLVVWSVCTYFVECHAVCCLSLSPEIYEPVDWLLQTWYDHYDIGFFLNDITF